MKATKYFLALPVIAIAITGAISPAYAQGVGVDADRASARDSRQLESALNDLDLSDSQKAQLRSLRENHRQATEGLRAQVRAAQQTLANTPRTDPNYESITAQARQNLESARTQLRTQQQQFQSNARNLLSPEQLNTLEANRAERRQRMMDRREGRMEQGGGREQRPRRLERRPRG
jgi:Spy/CpxP family protein refolding chaperone